jgi:hypothetical protein
MRTAQKGRNQNIVQVTRGCQWVNNTETLFFWYRHVIVRCCKSAVQMDAAGYSETLARAKKLRGLASQDVRICLSTTPPYTNVICKLHALFVLLFLCLFFQFPSHLLFFFSFQVTSSLTESPLKPPKNASELSCGVAGNMATGSVPCGVRNSAAPPPQMYRQFFRWVKPSLASSY